jgi:SAM-dependent methyltransferase
LDNWVFDHEFAQDYTKARQTVISEFLAAVRHPLQLTSALDVGCGVGYFSKFLSDLGFHVVAVDGRTENANEAQKRYPKIKFLTRDAEDPALPEIGIFDFVLCVGLLYHLENPFRTIRSLHSVTGKVLVIEAMCAPGKQPSLHLVDEVHGEDQGLNYVAFYPTETCIVKMLYRAGFPCVYGFENPPAHPLFHASLWRRKERTILVASQEPLSVKATGLKLLPDTKGSWEILWTPRERLRNQFDRIFGFLHRKVPTLSKAVRPR